MILMNHFHNNCYYLLLIRIEFQPPWGVRYDDAKVFKYFLKATSLTSFPSWTLDTNNTILILLLLLFTASVGRYNIIKIIIITIAAGEWKKNMYVARPCKSCFLPILRKWNCIILLLFIIYITITTDRPTRARIYVVRPKRLGAL
jgi:hypothetical protein